METVMINEKIWRQSSKLTNFRILCALMTNLGFKASLILFIKRVFSIEHYYVLQKSISQPIIVPKIRHQVNLRGADDYDIIHAVNHINGLDGNARRELISRVLFYRTGIKNCYAVKTKDDILAYLQWLIYPSQNDIIKKNFSGVFQPLKTGQVLIENVFTFPAFRGYGLMPHITAKLIEIAQNEGYKSAIMYIRKDKIESLSQSMMLGFKITSLLRELKIFGITLRKPINI